jgi:hypothetical protein
VESYSTDAFEIERPRTVLKCFNIGVTGLNLTSGLDVILRSHITGVPKLYFWFKPPFTFKIFHVPPAGTALGKQLPVLLLYYYYYSQALIVQDGPLASLFGVS